MQNVGGTTFGPGVSETKRALSPPGHCARRARTSIVRARGRALPTFRCAMSVDPFNKMTHGANRQYNRQNPAFANRPVDFAHFDHTSKWPEPVKWYRGRDENARPKLPYREDARGDDVSFAPKWDPSLTPQILLAALEDDASRVKDLISRGAGTECRTESGATPLICAASKGANDAVAALLEADANVVATDKIGANCLTLAAFHGRLDTARLILDAPAVRDVDGAADALLRWPTINGETPLMAAAKQGHANVVDELLARARGAEYPLLPYDDGGDVRGVTAVQLACRRGRLDAIKALIRGGADANERSGPRRMTSLMHAACRGHADVVAFLLDPAAQLAPSFRQSAEGPHAKPDVAETDTEGISALLHAACGGESVECFRLLARAWPGGEEAAYGARDRKGRNALMLAARFGGEAMCAHILAETGAYAAREFDVHKESALFAAIKGGFVNPGGVADMLLEAYPVHESELEMLEVKNVDGLTPLLWAARHGRTDAARWCARKGADMLATDSKGRVARQLAHARGHKETAEALSALAREQWMRI